jgi:hypothetical protein
MKPFILYWLKEIVYLTLILLFCSLLVPQKAYAYIDPGTGSIILQVVLGVLIAGMVSLKIFWSRVIGLFKKKFGHKQKNA